MVNYTLHIKADLEGVQSVTLDPAANLCVSVRNPLNPSEVRERVVIDPTALEETDVPDHEKHHTESPHHFALRWDGEKSRATVRVLSGASSTEESHSGPSGKNSKKRSPSVTAAEVRDLHSNDSGYFVPVLVLECEGVEPYAFHPMGGEFIITNNAGDKIQNADLSEGAWTEVELSSGQTSITNFESKFE
uniref:Uncharacterized protein n=1 Tax=Trieres chinensis TaxID=1514140 RepID=A0A7S1ZP67_TRICV|mmetsp:Transcript_30320/g.61837  ORF Transcript_30320/g.61837 Transcript_30320/m.61837 type:complete len:190 (+) Transcript_30320:107-676(+)